MVEPFWTPSEQFSVPPAAQLASTAPVWEALGHPGIVTVIGDPGVGKSFLGHQITEVSGGARKHLVSGARYETFASLMAAARDLFGGAAQAGDVLVVDGLDEISNMPSPEEVHWATVSEWLRPATVVIMRRPEPFVAMMRSRSVLSIGGPPPEINEDAGTPYWGTVVRLSWTKEELYQAIFARSGAPAAEDVTTLFNSGFLAAPDGGDSRISAIQRLIMSAHAALRDPSLLLTTDDSGQLRLIPASTLPETIVAVDGTSQSYKATPWLLYKRSGGLWIPQAAQLEELINDPDLKEQQLQEFFEAHPHLLAGIDYARVEPHPYLKRADQGPLIPDFMLEPSPGGFADVLDLKLPKVSVVVGKPDRLAQSAAVTSAIAQLREYRAWFDDASNQKQFQKKYNMQAYKPSVVMVIGRDPKADPYELRRLWADLPTSLKILTYDDLLRRIRRLGAV
jgi:Domain of unknown function (DUF4263)